MSPSKRILLNTLSQYIRTIINMVLSLYTIRIVLACLGQDDFGIYTLVAGVVAMLSFLTNSLVNTTQRFVSFYQGKNDLQNLKLVFNNSLIIHIVIGVLITIVLEAITPFLFSGFLNIPANRIQASEIVYQTVVVMLLTTFLTSPYRALLVSHENIVYISVIDVLSAVLKVVLVIFMSKTTYDYLIFYSLIMLGIQVLYLLTFAIYAFIKYEECVFPNFRKISIPFMKDIFSFAGWNVYGTGCCIGQKQGVAIVLNKFFGNAINAAYGIGFQLAGYASFLSSSIINAVQPQIVKSEGGGDRSRALKLSAMTSKLVFFLMSMVFIPCMFELDAILELWLGTPPDNSSLFCMMAILTILADSFTIGLTYINNAIGNIGLYTVVMNTPKFLTFPISWLMIQMGLPLLSVIVLYVGVELIMAMVRIFFIQKTAGLDSKDFIINGILREILATIISIVVCFAIVNIFSGQYRFVITFIGSGLIYSLSFFYLGLSDNERGIVTQITKSVLCKIRK